LSDKASFPSLGSACPVQSKAKKGGAQAGRSETITVSRLYAHLFKG
jgi:hypothetical protein